MDLQMLSLVLPSLMKDLKISSVLAGALGTYTLLWMGMGRILAGWLSDQIGASAAIDTGQQWRASSPPAKG